MYGKGHLARKATGKAVAVVLAFKGQEPGCEDDNWEHHVICCFIKPSLGLWVLEKMERLTASSGMNFEDTISFGINCLICFGWVSSWELIEFWFTEDCMRPGSVLTARACDHPCADDTQFYISTSDLYFEFQKYPFYFKRPTDTTVHCFPEKIWWVRDEK